MLGAIKCFLLCACNLLPLGHSCYSTFCHSRIQSQRRCCVVWGFDFLRCLGCSIFPCNPTHYFLYRNWLFLWYSLVVFPSSSATYVRVTSHQNVRAIITISNSKLYGVVVIIDVEKLLYSMLITTIQLIFSQERITVIVKTNCVVVIISTKFYHTHLFVAKYWRLHYYKLNVVYFWYHRSRFLSADE